jgi:hypothetical protein
MTPRPLALALACLSGSLAGGCAFIQEHHSELTAGAGAYGAYAIASDIDVLGSEFKGAMLLAYAIYDPLAPTWEIRVLRLDEDRMRLELRMKALATGGEGEARHVFSRQARELAEAGGFAGFDVIRFEEGIESTRPFARRFATGEIRLARSRTWPEM